MDLLISALSGYSIFQIVLFCLIIVFLIVFFTLFVLWRKGRRFTKLENTFYRIDTVFSLISPRLKDGFIINPNKKELIFFWSVVLSGLVSVVLSFTAELVAQSFSLGFMFELLFLIMLALLMVSDEKLAARAPYYYDHNPSLVIFCVVFLVYALIDFVISLSKGALPVVLVGVFTFVASILLYGVIVYLRFVKKEFRVGSLLIYIGGLALVIIYMVVFFGFCLALPALNLCLSLFGMLYQVGKVLVILYVFDGFYFVKRLIRRRLH